MIGGTAVDLKGITVKRTTAKIAFALAAVAGATATVLATSVPAEAKPPTTEPGTISYQLIIDGVALGVHQCTGIGTTTEVIERKATDPNGQPVTVRRPGRHSHHDLVCTRAMTDDKTLVEWQRQLLAGSPDARQDVDLTFFDTGGAEFARYQYVNAWPSELSYVESDKADGVLLEVVTIVADRLERVS